MSLVDNHQPLAAEDATRLDGTTSPARPNTAQPGSVCPDGAAANAAHPGNTAHPDGAVADASHPGDTAHPDRTAASASHPGGTARPDDMAPGAAPTHDMGTDNENSADGSHEGECRKMPQFRDIELVSDGWIKKYVLTYEMPDGSLYRYESVSRKGLDDYRAQLLGNAAGQTPTPDAVCIVPVLPDDSLLLIREFRYPVNAQVIAFPAGLLEPGETLAACVDRELREETGYRLRRSFDRDPLMPLPQSGYSSVGMAEENVRVVIAYVEPDGDAQPGTSEFIEHFTLTRDQVGPFLDSNRELIGTRCQLLLEAVRRTNVLRKRIALMQNPLRSEDFA